eukprot:SAG11_NODE_11688_length_744_cov_0.924031_1_plen_115_part_00
MGPDDDGAAHQDQGLSREVREESREVRHAGRLSEVIWGYLHGTQNYAQILPMAQGEQQNGLCKFLDPADQVQGILVRPYQKILPLYMTYTGNLLLRYILLMTYNKEVYKDTIYL